MMRYFIPQGGISGLVVPVQMRFNAHGDRVWRVFCGSSIVPSCFLWFLFAPELAELEEFSLFRLGVVR